MRLLLHLLSIWILSLARPDFESAIPFFELDENTRISGAYRHRSNRMEEKGKRDGEGMSTTRSTIRPIPHFGSISERLARSEGWVGGRAMKKIMIVKEKKKENEKVRGIHILSLPRGAKAVSLPSQITDREIESISDLRRKLNVSLKTGESILPPIDNTEATEWPPMRSTLPPKGGEFNKQTFLLLSGWLNSEKGKKRSQRKEDEEWNERRRIPMIRALARSRPIVRIDDIADSPNHNSISPFISITTSSPISTTQRITRSHRKRMKKPFQKKFKEFSSMSFSPLEENSRVTTIIPPSREIETTEFVENLAESIEKEESEVVNKRREHRKRNYGVNPLMYKVVDGVLYDRAGQPVRRVDIPFRDEPRRPTSFFGPAKIDREIEHDEISIHSTNHIFYEPTTPFSPHTSSFELDSSPLSLDPLPLPTAAMVSFPQSTTQFHWGSPLSTTPLPIMRDGKMPPPFPFINCYMNTDGFMCCNRTLESVLRSSYESLPCRSGKNGCSVQNIVKRVRNDVERKFDSSFEVVASMGDFAMHAHFSSDLTCKIEKEGRFIAAYATSPDKSSLTSITDYMMLPRDRSIVNPKDLEKKRKKIISNHSIPPPSPLPADIFNGGSVHSSTPQQSLEFLHTSTLSTTIPNISVNFDDQLDAPSIDVTKPDDNFHRVVPFHERSRGKNDFSFQ